MKKHFIINLTIIFIFSLFIVNLSHAALAGKITLLEGRVDVLKTGKNTVTLVKAGDPVDAGDIYRAKSDGRAEIKFINGNILKIAPRTRAEIKEALFDGNKSSNVIKLHRGRVQAISSEEFTKKVAAFAEGNRYEVHTPNAVAGIRGSNMIVSYMNMVTGTLFITGRGYQYNPNDPDKEIVNIVAGTISFISSPSGSPTAPRSATEGEIAVQINAMETITTGGDAAGADGDQISGDNMSTGSNMNLQAAVEVKKPEPLPPEPTPVPLPPEPTVMNYTGSIVDGRFYNDDFVGAGNITADMNGSIKDNNTVGIADFKGTYNYNNSRIWSGGFESNTDKDSAKNGVFLGYAGGSWTSWSGNAIGLLVENGNAGFLTTSPSGNSEDGAFTGSGQLVKRFIGATTMVLTEGQTWLDALKDINNVTTETFTITDQGAWSIGDATFSASKHEIENKTIKADLIGGKSIGVIREMLSGSSYNNINHATQSGVYGERVNDSYYSIGSASLADDPSHNKLTMNISNKYMTTLFLGTQSVYYEGAYDALNGPYRMVGIGTKEGAPLSFVSKVAEGRLQGLFGGTDSLWSGSPVSVTYMGQLVSGGGNLDIHACDQGWNSGYWTTLLPGGVLHVNNYETTNYVADPSHPVTQNISSPVSGNYASHGYFTNLLEGTTTFFKDGSDHPTGIEYTYNGGKVVASMQTLEWPNTTPTILSNTISYITSGGGKVLLLQNTYPWDSTRNNDILNQLGVDYDVKTAAEFASLDLSPYSTIIIASDQPQSFYNTMAGNIAKLEDFVGSGMQNVGFARINSYNYSNNTYTTYDGGAYRGFVGGAKVGSEVSGKDIAVYIAPDGSAGYLFSDLAGTVYDNANNMFLLNGNITKKQIKTATETGNILPQDLYNSVSVGNMDGKGAYFEGYFKDAGIMTGQEKDGYTMAIKNNTTHIAQNWGIYAISLYGQFNNPSAVWTGKFGGAGSFGEYYTGAAWAADSGYWLASVDDGTWANGWMGGNAAGTFITHTKLGALGGSVLGIYVEEKSSWELMSLGTWTADPLKFWSSFSSDLKYFDGNTMVNDGSITGALGGAAKSLGNATDKVYAPATALGWYYPGAKKHHIWVSEITSYNYLNNTDTTLDGWGAYKGYATGMNIDNNTVGGIIALYIDPDETYNAGYLGSDDLNGMIHADARMFAMAGGIKRVEMATNIGIAPKDILANIATGAFTSNGNEEFRINNINMGNLYNRPFVYQGENMNIKGLDWGIWYATIGGKYTGINITDSWHADIRHGDNEMFFGQYIVGSKWSDNISEGDTAGSGADLSSGRTWIALGTTMGTFDPNVATFQLVSSGIGISTDKYLSMINDPEGISALQKLNVPCVEVGAVNLAQNSQNDHLFNVAMNNVKFFGNANAEAPKIWATNSVTGNYAGNPLNQTVGLSGGGLNAQFTMKAWNTNNNTWASGIAGAGTLNGAGANAYNGAVQFKGVGAGQINQAAGSFSGTAAGAVRAGN